MSVAINSVIPTYQSSENYFQNGRDINLKFPGIIGNHTGINTLIDSTNNNVIFKYDSLITAGYTRTNAVDYLYPNDSFDSQNINMLDSSYTFHLQANGVTLIEFYIPEITVSMEELNSKNSSIVVYPNPTDDLVYINLAADELKSVVIYDVNGKYVKTNTTSNFSMKDHENGVYYLLIHTNQGTEVKKLIKQ